MRRQNRRTYIPLSTQRKRFSPLVLLGLSVPLMLALIVVGGIVFSHLMESHAANPAVNMDCTLLVPANPLTAQGLATPYQLSATNQANGPCNEANPNQSAFVQGVIFDPATGAFKVYSPLVIDQGTQPAVVPTTPTLPQGAVVGLWFGFNGNNLTLKGANGNTLRQGRCVNGLQGSVFGQFAYCNAPAFFTAANQGIAAGTVQVPALQMAKDGKPCPTVRDFSVVDQDQSDNVQTQYLANGNGQTAQFSAANQAQLQNPTTVANPSDNALLTTFIDPALGCTPWQAPDLANNNNPVSALPLDELQAAVDQQAPIALVPLTDPMTLVNNNQSLSKTNLYRRGVDQMPAQSQRGASGRRYCQNLLQTGLPRLQLDKPLTIQAASPVPAAANSLFTFLAQRFMMSYTNLNCQNLLNKPNPVTVQLDGNGVAIAATININGNNQPGNGNNQPANTNTNNQPNNTNNQPANGENNTPATTATPTSTTSPTTDPAVSPTSSPTTNQTGSPTASPTADPVASPTSSPTTTPTETNGG
jgi:hypothetical protein